MSNHSLQRYSTYSSTFGGEDNNHPNRISGLRRVEDRQMRMNFIWINNRNVTYSAWKGSQPSAGDCSLTSFMYFNTEELWETENCYNNHVKFFICEKPFSLENKIYDSDFTEKDVCNNYVEKDLMTSPYSGRNCQNWFNLSDNAKRDFDTNFSALWSTFENSTVCKDPSAHDIPWCYVGYSEKLMREPCFLQRKLYSYT
ncbi:uncharacterized protein LOC132719890 [Ruditapes philippinarum]|uniref:uncharacterized protein LOC132719890 n=1 Tax=Ruditapes philippinarum TaxID=129788 RepID=UPI00295A9CC4|nr:uncharacterized protein LOC132719890 [Ruditapes philippinarum]